MLLKNFGRCIALSKSCALPLSKLKMAMYGSWPTEYGSWTVTVLWINYFVIYQLVSLLGD